LCVCVVGCVCVSVLGVCVCVVSHTCALIVGFIRVFPNPPGMCHVRQVVCPASAMTKRGHGKRTARFGQSMANPRLTRGKAQSQGKPMAKTWHAPEQKCQTHGQQILNTQILAFRMAKAATSAKFMASARQTLSKPRQFHVNRISAYQVDPWCGLMRCILMLL